MRRRCLLYPDLRLSSARRPDARRARRRSAHLSTVRSVGTWASTGIRDMQAVGQDEDKDVDARAWRAKRMAWWMGRRRLLESAVHPPLDEVGRIWVEGGKHCAEVGVWGASCSFSAEGPRRYATWSLQVREKACIEREKTHLHYDTHCLSTARSPSTTNERPALPASSQPSKLQVVTSFPTSFCVP